MFYLKLLAAVINTEVCNELFYLKHPVSGRLKVVNYLFLGLEDALGLYSIFISTLEIMLR